MSLEDHSTVEGSRAGFVQLVLSLQDHCKVRVRRAVLKDHCTVGGRRAVSSVSCTVEERRAVSSGSLYS